MIPPELKQLEEQLAPSDLMSRINTFILGQDHYHWNLDEEFDDDESGRYDESTARLEEKARILGMEFACSGKPVATLGGQLFSGSGKPYRWSFGRGLAAGTRDKQEMWEDLVEHLHQSESEFFDYFIHAGFIEQLDREDRPHAQRILDQCLDDQKLRPVLVGLHPIRTFDEGDLDRCVAALDAPDVGASMFGELLRWDQHASLPAGKLLYLATRILAKPNGEVVLLQALSMKLYVEKPTAGDVLGMELRRIGLSAATGALLNNLNDPGGTIDHYIKRVIEACLRFDGNEDKKAVWLDTIFDVMDRRYGYLTMFKNAVRQTAELMPNEFLDRVFIENDESRQMRSCFLEHGSHRAPVLSGVEVKTLIAWCTNHNDPEAWKVIASGQQIWVSDDEDKTVRLSETAVQFLEASPVPEDILETFANKISPESFWGSEAETMERRAAALEGLFQHPNKRIQAGAQKVVEEAMKRISTLRQRERREHEVREQRFE